ncbi:Hsp90 co-chaperone AHA1-like protein [Elsinoe fawcettii]|nr:Hsp90 co-chaperone AHA1-like protein [Elsinoe fawcettii]
MVLHNPNNWHWVNKDVSQWTKEYLEKELTGLRVEGDGASAQISKVLSMDGDVDVSQRKGKVITIFDVRLQLEYTGETKDAEDVSGTITIPEVAHDTDEDDYVFEVEIYSEAASKTPVKDLVKSKLTPLLRQKFQQIGPALITEHGKDIQHGADHQPALAPLPKYSTSSHISKSGSSSNGTTTTSSGSDGPAVNTTKLTEQEEFRTTAAELYQTFTDPQRITAFTRAPPKVFEGAKPGGAFELFGGNVSGSYTKLDEPTYIEQKWRLASWPKGHFSTLKIKFEQNDVDAVTVMRVDWEGVPVGQEDQVKRNWGEYYVRSIKTTFGFGTVL